MKISAINTANNAAKQNFGAHMNSTRADDEYTTYLHKAVRNGDISKDFVINNFKFLDNILGENAIITIDKVQETHNGCDFATKKKFIGYITEKNHMADFDFSVVLPVNRERAIDALANFQSALIGAGARLSNSENSLEENITKKLNILG